MPSLETSSNSEIHDPNGWHGNENAWQEMGSAPIDIAAEHQWEVGHQYAGLTYEEFKAVEPLPEQLEFTNWLNAVRGDIVTAPDISTLPESFKEVEEIREIGEAALSSTVIFNLDRGDESKKGASTLDAMHLLETISERPILSLTIDGKKTNFTELLHYNPKVEATADIYPIPTHLSEILKDDKSSVQTYEKTITESRWQEKLFDFTQDFLANDPRAKVLIEGLDIESLTELTPEQATKLSLGIVQFLSKYSKDALAGGDIADSQTTLQLLNQGKMRRRDPSFEGNGVCRNIASNVKAVFEALKDGQSEQSMLGNTYVMVVGEMSGKTYGVRERNNPNGIEKDDRFVDYGHAWNTFVTVGRGGESVISTVDATWALGDAQPDYTIERTYESIQKLYEQADDKLGASVQMVHYLDKYVRKAKSEKVGNLNQRIDFAFTEYLKYADVMLEAGNGMITTPSFDVFGRAYRLRDDLSKKEIETVYGVGKINETLELYELQINGVVNSYMSRVGDETDRLMVKDDDLQRLIFERIGDNLRTYLLRDKLRFGGYLNRRFNEVMKNS